MAYIYFKKILNYDAEKLDTLKRNTNGEIYYRYNECVSENQELKV